LIGFLHGTVALKEPPVLMLDVHGVGYELKVPMSCFYDIPDLGNTTKLWVHVVYREDAQNIYGFLQTRDRDFFRELLKVNGVGPNLALILLSGLTVSECVQAVIDNDISSLIKAPGVGKRTAERLILELKPKIAAWADTTHVSPVQPVQDRRVGDAESALLTLGYKPIEARKVLGLVSSEKPDASSEDLIRMALRHLARA